MSKITQYVRHLAVVAIATLLAQCAWADYQAMDYTWTYIFHGGAETEGATVGKWNTIGNWGWTDDAGANWTDYASKSSKTLAPAMSYNGEGAYEPMLVDGDFIAAQGKMTKQEDGKYHVVLDAYGNNRLTLEGWHTRLGAVKDVVVEVGFNKLQSGNNGFNKQFSVDETSKIIIRKLDSGPQAKEVDVKVLASEGLTFGTSETSCNFIGGSCNWNINLGTSGSIMVFGNASGVNLLKFKDAVINPSTTGEYKKLSERVLLSYTGTSAGTFNAANSNAIVPSESSITLAKVDRKPIASTDAVGTYQIVNDTTAKAIKIIYVENSAEEPVEDMMTFVGEDGAWDTASNWSTGAVPTANDDVLISSAKTITLTTSSVAKSVTIAANATFTGAIDGTKIKGVTITDTSVLTINIASGASSLRNVSGGKIIKTGAGTLRFDNDSSNALKNTTVQIDAGVASVHNSNGDAVTTNPTFIIGENGTLDNKGWFLVNGTLTIESDYDKIVFPNTDGSGGVANNAMIGNSPAIVKKGTGTVTLRTGSNGNFGAVTVEDGNLIFGSKQNTTVAGVISGNGGIGLDGTNLDTAAGTLTLNGNNTYTGGTTITRGQVTLGNEHGVGAAGNTVRINADGILNTNSKADYLSVITLNGGTLKSGTSNVGTSSAQIRKIILEADSTVEASKNFGIVNNGHNATQISLNNHKLTKTGDGEFWLVNVTAETAGTIEIGAGTVHVDQRACNLTGVSFTVPADATDKVVQNAATLNPAPTGTIYQQTERTGGETIYVVSTTPTFVLGAGNAATVKEGDTVVFDSHYAGNKWSHIPQLSWANGEKIVVDIEMDIGSSVPENSELVVNHKNFSNPSDLKGDYLYGDIGAGATISGTGALFLGYTDNACTIGDGVTISCANVGFQSSGKTATINGTVTISAEVVMNGSKIKLADGAQLITAKLGDGDVTTDVAGKKVVYADGTYSLAEMTALEKLVAAIDAAAEGDTVTATGDIELEAGQIIEKAVVIDLGGNTLTVSNSDTAQFPKFGATFTNGKIAKSGAGYIGFTADTDAEIVLSEGGVYSSAFTLTVSVADGLDKEVKTLDGGAQKYYYLADPVTEVTFTITDIQEHVVVTVTADGEPLEFGEGNTVVAPVGTQLVVTSSPAEGYAGTPASNTAITVVGGMTQTTIAAPQITVTRIVPSATVTKLSKEVATAAGLDAAYAFTAGEAVEGFDDYSATFVVTFDKTIKAGSFELKGAYEADFSAGHASYDWTPMQPAEDINVGDSWVLLPLGTVTYGDVLKIGTFNCGVANKSADNVGTTMTVTLILTNGDETLPIAEKSYTLVAPAVQPIDPTEPKGYDDATAATAAAAAINADKAKYIAKPFETMTDTQKAVYDALVTAKVVGNAVVVDFSESGEKTAQDSADNALEATDILDTEKTEATVEAIPGLYYAIVGGTEVDSITTVGTAVQATGTTVTLTKPNLGTTTKAFYKVKISVTK